MSESTAVTVQPPTDPLSLLRLAIEMKVDADQLEKLVALQRQHEADISRKGFFGAMQQCQSEMPIIVKDSTNPHTKSDFASLECVQKISKPVYTRHGFAVAFSTEDSKLDEHIRIKGDVMHTGGHCETYRFDIPLDGKGAKGGVSSMNAPQATGSTFSYAQRYALKMIFNLTIAGEDVDGNTAANAATASEVEEIEELVEEVRRHKPKFNLQRFLDWLYGENKTNHGIGDMNAADFLKAKAQLLRDIKDAKAGAT